MSAEALRLAEPEAMSVRAVRIALGCWHDLLISMSRARNEFRDIGETQQADAIDADIVHYTQRCVRHLKRLQKASNNNGR